MRKKNDDLSEFQDWLCSTKNISKRTSAVYASNVRKILNEVTEINSKNLDAFIRSKIHSSSNQSNLMTGWKAFVEYTNVKIGVELAMPTPKSNSSEREFSLPKNVLTAFAAIHEFNKLRPYDLFGLHRKDFKLPPRGSMYEMHNPKRTWEITMIPKKNLDVIFKWGNPVDEPSIPVLPVEPMSSEPIPLFALKTIWKNYIQ